MSTELTIRFSDDMPPASVEVVSEELKTVKRVMLDGGREMKVDVPSERCVLRVHLPSGRMITLTEGRGDKIRLISPSMLEESSKIVSTLAMEPPLSSRKSLRDVRRYHLSRSVQIDDKPGDSEKKDLVQLRPGMKARVFQGGSASGSSVAGSMNPAGDEVTWNMSSGQSIGNPARLEIEHDSGRFYVLIPGNTRSLYVRTDLVTESESLLVSVRLATTQPAADSILNFLKRGDQYSADSMLVWAEESENLLEAKMTDPYAAAVGGYLLLKLRRFDLLRTWAKNLADRFDYLPDGSVIWAWQQIYQEPDNEAEIRKYLLRAASSGLPGMLEGLPVYSQGLRLLLDGLNMLPDDPEAVEATQRLRASAGAVLWNSPVTAGSKLRRDVSPQPHPVIYDVGFMAKA